MNGRLIACVILGLVGVQAVWLYAGYGEGGSWLDPGMTSQQEYSTVLFGFVLAVGGICLANLYVTRRVRTEGYEYMTIRSQWDVLERDVRRVKISTALGLGSYGLIVALAAYAVGNMIGTEEIAGTSQDVIIAMAGIVLAVMTAGTVRTVLGTIRTIRRYHEIRGRFEREGAL